MHLSSLTLKGFKSFASATTLRLEPGITAVVGPNGSGKSNVVDAIAWVLGEQGAKSLRGGKMEDVIFAGTAGRPALGRAEVTLTIDNSDGALPIEYTEVSITRRMYRSGESEYEINGDKVRLLDVQELLSDSGIGREMHVIVGQGQLDAVLSGRPEDRRAFIEEAAGVLKHRKRKEKALRKLDGMQANLDRLADLTAELRRQLKPLGRQAEVARRAAGVQADLRDARLRLLADDLVQLRDALDREVADETAARERAGRGRGASSAAASRREAALESELAATAPRLQAASDTWYRLSALDRAVPRRSPSWPPSGTATCPPPRPRPRPAATPTSWTPRPTGSPPPRPSWPPGSRPSGPGWPPSSARAAELESRRWPRPSGPGSPPPGRSPTGARAWPGSPARSPPPGRGSTAGQAEIERLALAAGEAADRAEVAAERLAERRGAGRRRRRTATSRWSPRTRTPSPRTPRPRGRVTELTEAERAAERDRASWQARRDALALGLTPADGAAAVLGAGLPGVLGPVADRLTVAGRATRWRWPPRWAAWPTPSSSPASPRPPPRWSTSRATDGGRAGLLVTGGLPPVPRDGLARAARRRPLGAGRRRGARPSCGPRWPGRSSGSPSCPTSTPPSRWCGTHPRVRAVTADGDLVGADWAVGGQRERALQPRGAGPGRRGRGRAGRAPSRGPPSSPTELAAAREAARARSADVEAALAARQAADRVAVRGRRRARRARRRRPIGRRRGRAARWPPACAPSRPSSRRRLASPAWRSGWPRPRPRRSRRSPRPRSGTGCAPRSPPPGRPRPRRGSPSAPPRSGPARCTAAPSRCAARRGRSGPPASGPRPPGSPASGAPRSPRGCGPTPRRALAALATSLARAAAERDALAVRPHRAGGRAAGGARPGCGPRRRSWTG